MAYEVVTTADEERGLVFPLFYDAKAVARAEGGEVWALADDEPRTRVMCVWPQEAARRHVQLADAPPRPEVAKLVAEAERRAAALVQELGLPTTYAEVVAVVARAYAEGRRDGYEECARSVGVTIPADEGGES